MRNHILVAMVVAPVVLAPIVLAACSSTPDETSSGWGLQESRDVTGLQDAGTSRESSDSGREDSQSAPPPAVYGVLPDAASFGHDAQVIVHSPESRGKASSRPFGCEEHEETRNLAQLRFLISESVGRCSQMESTTRGFHRNFDVYLRFPNLSPTWHRFEYRFDYRLEHGWPDYSSHWQFQLEDSSHVWRVSNLSGEAILLRVWSAECERRDAQFGAVTMRQYGMPQLIFHDVDSGEIREFRVPQIVRQERRLIAFDTAIRAICDAS